MRSSLYFLATALAYVSAQGASGAPEPTVTAAPGSLPLGAECATTEQCAGGAECWASNFMLIRRCGNFNAGCTSDSQCAFNSCNNGLCNGFVSSSATAAPTDAGPSGAPEPTVTAAPGSLPLGAECATTEQCAGGAQCWASNAMLIRACGNFNAACTSDAQCAFNSCNNGLCNGLLSSSVTAAPTDAPGPSGAPEPTVTAAPGTLPLGAECATTEQCAGGAECWASNAMLIRRCGNFNAGCTSDSQCAFNSCNNGLCNGFLSSSGTVAPTDVPGPSGAPEPTVTAAPGTLELGAECATTEQCAAGAQCWASNAMLIRRCGNFNAACTADAQCAFNTCNNGLCNGVRPSGTVSTPPLPTVTAPAGSLPLGATCSSSEQCAGGAQCYATNSMLIPACGNFQAACSSDAQCAFNTCNQGFCNGLKASTSLTTATQTSRSAGGASTSQPAAPPSYTGAANKKNVGVAGVIGAAIVAFAL